MPVLPVAPGAPHLRLIAGPGVYICAECVGLCDEILTGEMDSPRPR